MSLICQMCRHGDRNAFGLYPKSPFQSPSEWPGGFAQLTEYGNRQHMEVGRWLRRRFMHLITSAKRIYVKSTVILFGFFLPSFRRSCSPLKIEWTLIKQSSSILLIFLQDRKRTKMSARANLSGLYPSAHQTIPINSDPAHKDYLLLMKARCDRFDYVMLKYMNETRYKTILRDSQPLMRQLEKDTGKKPLKTLSDLWGLYDTLWIEQLKKGSRWVCDFLIQIVNLLFWFLLFFCFPVRARNTIKERKLCVLKFIILYLNRFEIKLSVNQKKNQWNLSHILIMNVSFL